MNEQEIKALTEAQKQGKITESYLAKRINKEVN